MIDTPGIWLPSLATYAHCQSLAQWDLRHSGQYLVTSLCVGKLGSGTIYLYELSSSCLFRLEKAPSSSWSHHCVAGCRVALPSRALQIAMYACLLVVQCCFAAAFVPSFGAGFIRTHCSSCSHRGSIVPHSVGNGSVVKWFGCVTVRLCRGSVVFGCVRLCSVVSVVSLVSATFSPAQHHGICFALRKEMDPCGKKQRNLYGFARNLWIRSLRHSVVFGCVARR